MKMKKITSYIVAFTMVVGTIGTNVLANPEEVTMNYTDYKPGEMPASLMKWAAGGETEAKRSGERGWMEASRNCHSLDNDKEFDGNILKIGWGTAGSYSPRTICTFEEITGKAATVPDAADGELTVGADGMASMVYTAYDPNRAVNYFKMDNTKNYVFRVDIKDNRPDQSPAPVINLAFSNDSVATRAWSKEYGENGFSVTGEYKTYAGTFDLPDNFNNDGKQIISAGFMVGNGAGESIAFKTGNLGDVYCAEEVAYDIENNLISGGNVLFSGASATFEASVLNQIGSEGYLNQNFTWKVLNEERTEEVEEIEVSVDDTTKKATITVGDTVKTGTYTIVAVSDTYEGFVKGADFKVYADDYYKDYEKGEIPGSLMKWAAGGETEAKRSGERGWSQSSRNCHGLDTDRNFDGNALQIGWGDDVGSYSPRSIYTVSEITGIAPTVGGDGMASTVYTAYDPNRTVNYFKMDNSKNYVFRVYVKDNHPDKSPAPVVNFAVSNDSVATRTWSKEYGAKGFSVTGEYKAYAGTFNLSDSFNNNGKQVISAGFMIGNGAGESISFKTGELGDVYFAEEVPYDIIISKKSEGNAAEESPAVFEAKVLNQIESTGYLNQNFIWRVKDAYGTDVTDDMKIKTDNGTSTVTITPGKNLLNGSYTAYAISVDYKMTRSIEFDVVNEKDDYNIYVDAKKGDDGNPGTEASPLKSFKAAKALVRSLKTENPAYQYVVNFADGEYYFDETEKFTAEDSGENGSPVIYKAVNPGKAIFTGAVKIDTSNAKKVTDKNILARMYDDVRGKVYEIDLLESGFPYSLKGEQKHPSATGPMLNSIEYPELYLDNQEQMIAQWPNGEGNYSKVDLVVDKTSFRCKNDDFSRWTTAKDMWVGGYYIYDYGYRRHYVESVDGESNIITLEDTGVSTDYMGVLSNISMRYKAFNLLEEIDVPGEWYIDKESMKLYYYIPENIGDKNLEITALKERMFVIKDTDYVKFSGIEFTKTRDEVIYMTDVSGIEIADCTFKNVLVSAITANGTEKAETDKDYWQIQDIDGANDCVIENCLFENIGAAAISITGGNVDTLEDSGTVIRNNIFYKFGQKAKYNNAIKVYGCGVTVEHNNISSAPCSAISTMGNNHIIRYNEIYDVCQETDDCGAIYQGRSALQRGTEVSYNYLHNLNSIEELPYKFQNGIYWDDSQGGQYVHDNIIKDVRQDVYNAGVDNVFEDNISINVEKTLYFKNGSVPTHNNDSTATGWYGYIKNPDIYYAKYPNLEYIINNYGSKSLASLTKVNGNLAVNATEVALEDKVSASGNVQTDKTDIFMDSNAQDFRISKAKQAELGISNNLNEDFDIELIGVQSNKSVSADTFKLNFPMDNEIVIDSENVYFNWENLTGANWYELVVAKDAEFKDIVYENVTPYNYDSAKLSLENGKYYWKVEAKNTSREFGFAKSSDVSSFRVGENYVLTDFEQSIEANKRAITGKLTYNGDSETISDYVYIAVYDADNKLKGVSRKNYNFTKGVETDIISELAVNADDFYIRIFVWSADNIARMLSKTFVIVD